MTSRRVSSEGVVELTYADGSSLSLTPGSKTRTFPDGRKQSVAYAHAQPPTPPSAPPDMTHSRWLDDENERLLSIIRALIGNDEDSLQNYLTAEGVTASPYGQVSARTRAIGLLTQP